MCSTLAWINEKNLYGGRIQPPLIAPCRWKGFARHGDDGYILNFTNVYVSLVPSGRKRRDGAVLTVFAG